MQRESLNKTVIITGASNGIGYELAKYFIKKKFKVVNIDICKCKNNKIENVIFDLRKTNEIDNLLGRINKKFKKIDVLINNARSGFKEKFLHETLDNWNNTFDINLKAHFFLTQELIRNKLKKNFMSIINISSVASELVSKESASYHMSKASIDMMTKYFAYNSANLNVSVFSLKLGMILQKRFMTKFNHKNNNKFRRNVSLYQNGAPYGLEEDVISAVEFLMLKKSKFLTGSILNLAGGANLGEQLSLLTKNILK
jgi:NAD(P)-dependent dehydrogenase (short-subunit alcohol dehydrogenase family)